MAFTARYPQKSTCCDAGIREGDKVQHEDEVLVHVDCTDVERAPEPAPPTICMKCWQTKAANGACGCDT